MRMSLFSAEASRRFRDRRSFSSRRDGSSGSRVGWASELDHFVSFMLSAPTIRGIGISGAKAKARALPSCFLGVSSLKSSKISWIRSASAKQLICETSSTSATVPRTAGDDDFVYRSASTRTAVACPCCPVGCRSGRELLSLLSKGRFLRCPARCLTRRQLKRQ